MKKNTVCAFLRWKGYNEELEPDEIAAIFMHNHVPYQCLRTCQPWGIDDTLVAPETAAPTEPVSAPLRSPTIATLIMTPKNPDYGPRVVEIFESAPFIHALGIELESYGPGWCNASLDVAEKHLQQDGFIHAGVQATLADHTAGAAAGTLMAADEVVLTIEFKINLLRPAVGHYLSARARVLRAGRRITVVESGVFVIDDSGVEKQCAKLTATMALTPAPSVS